jgi:uncharacterized protein (TIGR03435 family)
LIKDSPGLRRSEDQEAGPHAIGSSTGFGLENISMREFAELLSGVVTVPVIDKTGLDGKFSFTLTLGVAGSGDDFQGAIGGAVQEQLGLKMEKQKIQLEMLIIDRVEKKPTDN